MSLHLAYIAESGLKNMVFESQVLHLLQGIRNLGMSVHLAVLEIFDRFKDQDVRERLDTLRRDYPDTIHMRGMPQAGRLTCQLDALRLSRWASKCWEADTKERVIHGRGHFGSFTAIKAFGCERVVSDLRGLLAEEVRHYPGTGIRRYLTGWRISEIEAMERYLMDHSRYVLCVSHAFKKYLLKKYSAEPSRVEVVPTVVDTDHFYYDLEARTELRTRLNLKDRLVFVYSGGLSGWQVPHKVVGLFVKMKEKIPEAFLIFLTHHPKKAEGYFKDMDKGDYLLQSCAYKEIPPLLKRLRSGDSPERRESCQSGGGPHEVWGVSVLRAARGPDERNR